MDIVLTTLNARYAHSSLALRYLQANLGELQSNSQIIEFVIGVQTEVAAQEILTWAPRIVAFSVYIWNVEETTRLIALLKTITPELIIVIGGPEVSHEYEQQAIVRWADYLIIGAGERRFAQLCRQLCSGDAPLSEPRRKPLSKYLVGDGLIEQDTELVLPYRLYSDDDIKYRYLYVEASRGCPYKCEFCLSSLDKTAVPLPLARFLDELAYLYDRGARHFKFIDRTFNLRIDDCVRLLDFFLERIDRNPTEPMLLHFELIPDHLPERLRAPLSRFPAACLQFEIGIQTFNPAVQKLISRRQNDQRALENLRWLRQHTQAHLHVDLIAGLPGESIDSFGAGFDRLVALRPHEIQIGILKRLRGTPITRHSQEYQLRFNPSPPYNVLSTNLINFAQMQAISRFARYWDMIGNSGHFRNCLPWILFNRSELLLDDAATGCDSPFARFSSLCDSIYARCDRTHRISAEHLYQWVDHWLAANAVAVTEASACLRMDRVERGLRALPNKSKSKSRSESSAESGSTSSQESSGKSNRKSSKQHGVSLRNQRYQRPTSPATL